MKALAPLLLAALGAGCSVGVDPLPADAPPPPALAIVGPEESLFYTAADDEDPDVPGIQLTIRVDVDDEAIDEVRLGLDGLDERAVVAEDLAGRRAAFFAVTLGDAGEHPAVARAQDAEARAVLVAR